ncbi:MAG: hypothetical protein Q4E57_01720 [Eubacteriales bacterium]|nr:hypothetical protein [Eubacteriales bacterium]
MNDKVIEKLKERKAAFSIPTILIIIIAVALLGIFAAHVISKEIEKSREAADLANVRTRYAEVMVAANGNDTDVDFYYAGEWKKTVDLKQQKDGWQIKTPVEIGGISSNKFGGTNPDLSWVGTPKTGGYCEISYSLAHGLRFKWGAVPAVDPRLEKVNDYVTAAISNFFENVNTAYAVSSGSGIYAEARLSSAGAGLEKDKAAVDAYDNDELVPVRIKADKKEDIYRIMTSVSDIRAAAAGGFPESLVSNKEQRVPASAFNDGLLMNIKEYVKRDPDVASVIDWSRTKLNYIEVGLSGDGAPENDRIDCLIAYQLVEKMNDGTFTVYTRRDDEWTVENGTYYMLSKSDTLYVSGGRFF